MTRGMPVLYLDSSAFIKLYTDENPAQTVQVEQAMSSSSDLASSAIAHAEVCGAFGRQFQQGRLSEEAYWQTRQAFETDWQTAAALAITQAVSSVAADLLKAQPGLRAMDALHLASALALRQSTPIRFLSFDVRLNTAARALMPDAF